jgi:hypothetical protein
VLARLARATSSLAHSLAIQIAATASVTLAIATIPWLHDATMGPAPATPPASPASVANSTAPAGAGMVPVSSVSLAGVAPLESFPMEGEERFSLSLSRPYVVLASTAWHDGRAEAPVQPIQSARAGKRRAIGDGTEMATLAQDAAGAVAALPRERPADLGRQAMPYVTEDAPDESPIARLVSLRLPTLPPLPSAGEVSARLGSQADEARQALTRTAAWAADAVGGVLPRF